MDTKLKNSRKIRIALAILLIILVTIGNFFLFPLIGANAEQDYEKLRQDQDIDEGYMTELIQGSYILYYEVTKPVVEYPYFMRDLMECWMDSFERLRYEIDYLIKTQELMDWNTSMKLEQVLKGEHADAAEIAELQEWYQYYFVLEFDENGELSVTNVWDRNGREEEIIKTLLKCNNTYSFEEHVEGYLYDESGYVNKEYGTYPATDESDLSIENSRQLMDTWNLGSFPQNCQIVYAVSRDAYMAGVDSWMDDYWGRLYTYSMSGSGLLYIGTLVVLALGMFILTSNKIFRKTIDFNRRGPWYLAEAAIIGVIRIPAQYNGFLGMNLSYVTQFRQQNPLQLLRNGNLEEIMNLAELAFIIAIIYVAWYVCMIVLRPVLTLGPIEYIRQYSLIYLVCSKFFGWCRRCWNKTKDEVSHIDFSNKTIRTIRKVVIMNFIILAVLSCFWFFGIIALIVYSIVLFYLIKKQYDKVEQDYQSLGQATSRIAQGDLKYEDTNDWGVFEPLKSELAQIRSGFSRAVEEEVKSQRMKAELITNVSHDLKTPLTAITTYVELLKNPDLTEEQRRAYVEILEKKSLRLKVLVEDLFEVSKATSNTIKLNLMEVDVVNLLKQVCVEHEERFADMGLSVKWKLPEEKVTLMLDNQKTYRIFENLFMNIEKYAMPNSRVFVEVAKAERVQIVIKNMSAQELFTTGEEITERFVRGDSSRTTEGSGLGLAIAKSFTEAQKGSFEVTVDGDLFKVVILW